MVQAPDLAPGGVDRADVLAIVHVPSDEQEEASGPVAPAHPRKCGTSWELLDVVPRGVTVCEDRSEPQTLREAAKQYIADKKLTCNAPHTSGKAMLASKCNHAACCKKGFRFSWALDGDQCQCIRVEVSGGMFW